MDSNDRLDEWLPEEAVGYPEDCENKFATLEIDMIARDLGLPPAEIAEIYAQLYAELKARARVTDYLRVFVSRKVRARYPHRRLS